MMSDAYLIQRKGNIVYSFNDNGKCCACYSIVSSSPYLIDHWGEVDQDYATWLTKTRGPLEILGPCRPAGEYHPRIWAPGNCPRTVIAGGEAVLRQSVTAAAILIDKLNSLFKTIEPVPENMHVFGHEVRNLLLLACMEVESALKSILQKNHHAPMNKFYTTRDYVRLRDILKLDTMTVKLRSYPDYPTIKPFHNWDSLSPTESLEWYAAYNGTKHDREGSFSKAKLCHAITAIAAVVCMIYVQFGPSEDEGVYHGWDKALDEFLVSIVGVLLPFEKYYIHFTPNDHTSWKSADIPL